MTSKGLTGTVGLTPLQIEFCHQYAHGPEAGNGAKCIGAAGYAVGSPGAAAAMASELLARDDVRRYLALLYAERRAGRVLQARPWERLLPAAQALQLEVIEAGRDAVAHLRGRSEGARKLGDGDREDLDGEGETLQEGLNPALVTGPMVNLIRAALDAAETVEAYAVGRPVTRTEQGAPGAFKEQGLRETVTEIRESMALLEAAGLAGLLEPGAERGALEGEVEGEVEVEGEGEAGAPKGAAT
jgi:hypothetical protein